MLKKVSRDSAIEEYNDEIKKGKSRSEALALVKQELVFLSQSEVVT